MITHTSQYLKVPVRSAAFLNKKEHRQRQSKYDFSSSPSSKHHFGRTQRHSGYEESREGPGSIACQSCSKDYDVVALGNLCVDVVVPFPELPSLQEVKKLEMLDELTRRTADGSQESWEAGGQSNFMIAAARLGLQVASAGNVGQDMYANFLKKILQEWSQEEGVLKIEPLALKSFEERLQHTLVCFVLVDPAGKHHFCSRYDFGPWPLLPGVDSLPQDVLQTLQSTRALFINGFIFDELPGPVVLSAVACANRAGAATFFDPGPRAWTLRQGERKKSMDVLLDASHVVLMTQEEAEAVTGHSDAEQAAISIVDRPGSRTEWCVIKLGPQGALIRTKHPPQTLRQAALQVPVADTVGCGDSFAAGIVLGYIQKQPLPAVLALSNAVGAATATSPGAGRNVASTDTVRGLLSRQASSSSLSSGSSLKDEEYDAWIDRLADEEISAGMRESVAVQPWGESASEEETRYSAEGALKLLEESLKETS